MNFNKLWPLTRLGKWSIILAIIFVVLMMVPYWISMLMQRYGNNTAMSVFAIPGIVSIAAGIASFITGLISIIRTKERGILVFIATFIGLMALAFIVGEFAVPH